MTAGRSPERPAPAGRTVRILLRTWLPVLLYVAAIMVMAVQPVPKLLRLKHLDKIVHIALYGFLACLAFRSFLQSGARRPGLLAVLLAVAVGAAEEGLQGLAGRRNADRYDIVADALGAVTAVIAVTVHRRTERGRSGKNSGKETAET